MAAKQELKVDEELKIEEQKGRDDDIMMAFKLLDKNGDGRISIKELQEVFTNLNFKFTGAQLKKMVSTIDIDGDGEVDIDEFTAMMSEQASSNEKISLSPEDELKEVFKLFDTDGNGKISPMELAQTMKALGENLSPEDIKSMMSEVDENNDKQIDFDEFKKMMAQGPQ
jgi:Ca2+-binding EF-hand superfamily protein